MATNYLRAYIAVDFGAGSGRVMAGCLVQDTLTMEEIFRFSNRQLRLGNHIYWDFLSLFDNMKKGLKIASQREYNIKGIGIDTWGVDFGLIDANGDLIGNPVCYRDSRTTGMPEKVLELLDMKQHYNEIGIQVLPINTLYQLYSMKQCGSQQLQIADKLLFMPDLFSYYLTGVANNEYSISTTSELIDARSRQWSENTIDRLGLPAQLFGDIVLPGTVRGKLKENIAKELGLDTIDVIAVGSHDTASAVAATPFAEGKIKAFLSSGTWSLLGVELDEPILTEEARLAGFTNEGGVGGTIRFLQNITGLWIMQRLMEEWKSKGEELTYKEILSEASQSSIRTIIAVDDPMFTNPENMELAIKGYCIKHNLQVPLTNGELIRCVLQSLAFRYKQAVEKMNKLLPQPIEQLHIIGGGSQNTLLNQLTANYLGIPVYAGPIEATAMGNILVQALAKGDIADIKELRNIVRKSVIPHIYYPTDTE